MSKVILFVARQDSIHTARWIRHLVGKGWSVHLFPSTLAGEPHEYLIQDQIRVYFPRLIRLCLRIFRLWAKERGYTNVPKWFTANPPPLSVRWLTSLINSLNPDIIHSLEIQHAGYLTLEVQKKLGNKMPTWIVGNWGSDIYLFGQLSLHRERVKEVLQQCDYYTCECERDVRLALDMGLQGEVLPVLPNAGGFDLEMVNELKSGIQPSKRRQLVLKGYQGWAGRALVGLRAIELCADLLDGYKIVIPLASDDVALAAELFSQRTEITTEVLPYVSHDEMLRIYSRSRLYIGLSISDAISQSMLEAIVMGAFPIQSSTSCADEWIKPGISGLIVPPEDPHIIADALRNALLDDEMVDSAAAINWQLAKERLDEKIIRPQVVAMYERIFGESRDD